MKNEEESPKGHRKTEDSLKIPDSSHEVLHLPQPALISVINRWYDPRMFGPNAGIEFDNYGYWERHTRTYQEAYENLMEKLLSFIPEKKGMILDVACGKGGTTKYLLNYYRPANVTGINISKRQLERCAVNAPGCKFLLMNATELDFDNNSFDNIICVEAVFHFRTREKFLREAQRVLKPGGRLVLSDIFIRRWANAQSPLNIPANYVQNLRQYKQIFARAGFGDVQIIDATLESWIRFYRRTMSAAINSFQRGEINRASLNERVASLRRRRQHITHYLLVSTQKSAGEN